MSNITELQNFNRENINFIDWGQDINSIENELEIFVK